MEGFSEWWARYPKKLAKLEAMKAWEQTKRHHPSIEEMLAVLEQHRQSEQWLAEGGKFIPHAATYLRRGQFLDEFEVDLGANKNGKPWHETASGTEAKGRELGLSPDSFRLPDGRQDWSAFRSAVLKAAGVELKRAA